MAIDVKTLKPSDIGRFCMVGGKTLGRLHSWKGEYLIVVVNCCGQWARYREFSGHMIPPHEVTFCDGVAKEIETGYKKLDYEIMT
jgi:hypothetical protein